MEKFMNHLTDMDWGWWPFLFLRPAMNEKMTTARVARMSIYFGVLYGLLMYLALIMPKAGFDYTSAIFHVACMVVIFFFGYLFTFAYFWNKRAERLQAENNAAF